MAFADLHGTSNILIATMAHIMHPHGQSQCHSMATVQNGIVSPTILNQRSNKVVDEAPKCCNVPMGMVNHLR
jgi:hypothetical protein